VIARSAPTLGFLLSILLAFTAYGQTDFEILQIDTHYLNKASQQYDFKVNRVYDQRQDATLGLEALIDDFRYKVFLLDTNNPEVIGDWFRGLNQPNETSSEELSIVINKLYLLRYISVKQKSMSLVINFSFIDEQSDGQWQELFQFAHIADAIPRKNTDDYARLICSTIAKGYRTFQGRLKANKLRPRTLNKGSIIAAKVPDHTKLKKGVFTSYFDYVYNTPEPAAQLNFEKEEIGRGKNRGVVAQLGDDMSESLSNAYGFYDGESVFVRSSSSRHFFEVFQRNDSTLSQTWPDTYDPSHKWLVSAGLGRAEHQVYPYQHPRLVDFIPEGPEDMLSDPVDTDDLFGLAGLSLTFSRNSGGDTCILVVHEPYSGSFAPAAQISESKNQYAELNIVGSAFLKKRDNFHLTLDGKELCPVERNRYQLQRPEARLAPYQLCIHVEDEEPQCISLTLALEKRYVVLMNESKREGYKLEALVGKEANMYLLDIDEGALRKSCTESGF